MKIKSTDPNYNPDFTKVLLRDDFRQIPNLPDDKYYINSEGDIMNHYTGKILKDHIDRSGYRAIQLWHNDIPEKKRTYRTHRLVASTFIPNPDPENCTMVLHNDNIKTHCEVENLRWGTASENIIQSIQDNLHYLPDSRKWYTIYNEETGDEVKVLGPQALADAIEFKGTKDHVSCVTKHKHPLTYGPYKGYRVKIDPTWTGERMPDSVYEDYAIRTADKVNIKRDE